MADSIEAQTRANLLATAQRASDTLSRSVAGKPDDISIETNAQSLRGLAEILRAMAVDAAQCGGLDCMGRTIDGTRLWVTQDRFNTVERRMQRYEAALRAIAAGPGDGSDLDMLIDWQSTAKALAASARRAIDDPTDH